MLDNGRRESWPTSCPLYYVVGNLPWLPCVPWITRFTDKWCMHGELIHSRQQKQSCAKIRDYTLHRCKRHYVWPEPSWGTAYIVFCRAVWHIPNRAVKYPALPSSAIGSEWPWTYSYDLGLKFYPWVSCPVKYWSWDQHRCCGQNVFLTNVTSIEVLFLQMTSLRCSGHALTEKRWTASDHSQEHPVRT